MSSTSTVTSMKIQRSSNIMSSFNKWLLIALFLCILAVSTSQAYEIRTFDLDGYPSQDDYYVTAERNPLHLYRLMKRAASAVKRERIVMDAMGGDYLVRKRSVF